MIELPRLTAVELRHELSTGATRPCVMACQGTDASPPRDYVVKFRSEVRGGPTGLAFELLAAKLASRLSIPMPSPALIEIPADLPAAIPDAQIAARLRASIGLNFGTRFLSPGYVTWPIDESIPVSMRQSAVEIIAFDALIDNSDRRRDKPNLLWRDDELFVIDHELAFAFTRLVGGGVEPFSSQSLSFLETHPLRAGLRRVPTDLRRFAGELESLKAREVDLICGSVPSEFGTEYFDRIADWLKRASKLTKQLELGIGRLLQ